MTVAPGSIAGPMIFKQGETIASHMTWLLHAVNSADSTDATGKTLTATISKAGGAFAAVNAGTVITELTNGWYKVVHNTADLDTLGALAVRVIGTGVDTVNIVHRVQVQDPYQANDTVILKDGSLTAAKYSSDGLAAGRGKVEVKGPNLIGTLTSTALAVAQSMKTAIDNTVTLSGTFNGATVRIETTEDETAATPVWTDQSAGGLTSTGSVVITGPHSAWRAHVQSGSVTSVAVKSTQRFAA